MRQAHYDLIIIGTGAGGGTMAHALAETGARILLLERGDFVPQEEENWSADAVWKRLRYRTTERWLDARGREFQPYTHYCVGGNTKFWGSVLYRLRREDFDAIEHRDGISPAWPIDYDTLEPYYDRAERLYHVHGQNGVDPTEAPRGPYPLRAHPACGRDGGARVGAAAARPAPFSVAARTDPPRRTRAGACSATRATRSLARSTRRAKPTCAACGPRCGGGTWSCGPTRWPAALITDGTGARIEAVEVERNGEAIRVAAPLFVVSCGAVNSAALLLRSATDSHPNGAREFLGAGGPPLHGAPRHDDAGVPPVPAERDRVPEDRRHQRLLLAWPRVSLSPRADSVTGSHPRRDGANRRPRGFHCGPTKRG